MNFFITLEPGMLNRINMVHAMKKVIVIMMGPTDQEEQSELDVLCFLFSL